MDEKSFSSKARPSAASERADGTPALSVRFSWAARWRSFRPAMRGIADLLRTQHNARIHSAATLAVVAAAFTFRVSRVEWCALILTTALVWITEALNTAIEFLADEVTTQRRSLIGRAKDVGAGAVLISSLGAATVGTLIFYPHLAALWLRR